MLSAPHLTPNETDLIKAFLSLCYKVELTQEIINQTVAIRRQTHLKVPDAIVAASAIHLQASLVTADAAFQKVAGLTLISDILA